MRKRLLSLYPEAWRRRYGEEMRSLIEETPPSLTAIPDLLRGAIAAHLRPLAGSPPAVRARGTIAFVLGCFIVFCVFGAGFGKTTENFDPTEHLHPLLGISHSVILVAAVIGAGALALGACPLAIASLRQARRTRDPALLGLIAVPPAAICIFAGSVGLLALWLNAHRHDAGVGRWALLGLSCICAAGGGFACWAAPRAIMRRIDIPRRALVFSVPSLALVALCMTAIAIATGVFLIALTEDAPNFAAASNGPGQLIDVTTSIAIQFAAMLTLSMLATVSAARGLRSLRSL